MKHIVVVDGVWGGHHPGYLKTFVQILLEEGYRVTALCPAPNEMTVWVANEIAIDDVCFNSYCFFDLELAYWRLLPGQIRLASMALVRWFRISRAINKISITINKPDMIFFSWLDSYLCAYLPAFLIDWMCQYTWSGLYFHPIHLRREKKFFLTSKLFKPPENLIARSKYGCCLAVLDAGIINKLRSRLAEKHVFLFPDFTDEAPYCENDQLIEQIKAKAKNRAIIGLIGSLEKRKGFLTLLELARQSSKKDWFFVFAGDWALQTFSKQELMKINSFIGEQRDNCFFYMHKIPEDSQFNALVKICDVLFAAYLDFPHSSNMMTKAAIYRKNMVVSSGGYMEEVVKKYTLGEVVPPGDIQASIVCLDRLTSNASMQIQSIKMQNYCRAQSREKLRQELLSLVKSCIKLEENDHNRCGDR